MTSNSRREPTEAYVWVWLPGATKPVVAGLLEPAGDRLLFTYGRSYLANERAIPIYLPELPLRPGRIEPAPQLAVPGCIADAGPDAWGMRVVMRHLIGAAAEDSDPAILSDLTYLLESGSDRIGALDFQASGNTYRKRNGGNATLAELQEAAARVDEGEPLTPELDQALLHGSSVGGARPKALLSDGDRKLIAKFSSSSDPYEVVKGEFVAMELARRAGLDVAPVQLERSLGKEVLLVERFDRRIAAGGELRRAIVSALTILELPETQARYATYHELAQQIRQRFTQPKTTLRELFSRITFNILVGNNDDHPRNHAAFWDGGMLTLTPAYDICPQPRSGRTSAQLMAIDPSGFRDSQLNGCVEAASLYGLTAADAREIIEHQIAVIKDDWNEVCDMARLTEAGRSYFLHRQFLNPFAFEGWG
jgi:serine/threonine-protein kinase HipA